MITIDREQFRDWLLSQRDGEFSRPENVEDNQQHCPLAQFRDGALTPLDIFKMNSWEWNFGIKVDRRTNCGSFPISAKECIKILDSLE